MKNNIKNNNNSGEIIIYEGADRAPNIEVRVEGETVWLSIDQMAELFGKSRSTINEHILNIYAEKELQEVNSIRKIGNSDFSTKPTNYYNLDVIISVGYRVKSQRGTHFRQWATARLKEYIIKGFTMNDDRLKNLGGGKYWYELLDRIRDIRSSEKVLYRQVLDLYATSQDYNPKSSESIEFFKIVQNKLHYAAHGHTASEVIAERANAGKPFMGLLTFSKGGVVKKDIAIAKNYLTEKELKILNNLVSGYFDFAEIQAMKRNPMYMKDYIKQLDNILSATGEKLLSDAGSVSHEKAIDKAELEYKKYQEKTLSEVEKVFLESVKGLEKKVGKRVKTVSEVVSLIIL
ncbi:MAG: cell filamentation protein Fic [Parcubacteria group bacterium CG_4_9_14_0_2_um_filter_41_8]|nr:MAG: cell filamentation protein Fic [Parcubacteria group bacterium CG11_big_fil_rev_8_21_14_0_20_41_14]PJC40715.1 MAG: cell filamentation protein Fic [Parcubacteria group bacterium CG_4_9_14_0_2_um_filter_41_8]